jgi:hypothetical protein
VGYKEALSTTAGPADSRKKVPSYQARPIVTNDAQVPGRLLAVGSSVALRKGVAALPQRGPSFRPAHIPVPIPLRNGTAVVNCGLGCAAKGYIRPCIGFTIGGLEVG